MYIHRTKDLSDHTTTACDRHIVIGKYKDGMPAYCDEIADGIYDYVTQNWYNKLDSWVETAVKKH